MSDLKRIIDRDIEAHLPARFYENLDMQVMKSIQVPKHRFNLSFAERKDDIILCFMIIFCSTIVYFFGYSDHYKVSIYISKELIFNILSKFIVGLTLVVFFINDYFDRKKKILY